MKAAERIEEIQDPTCRAKLEGIQETVYSIDAEKIKVRQAIDEKRGVLAAANAIAERLNLEGGQLVQREEAGEMDHDEVKVRADQTQHLVGIVRSIASENQRDLMNLQGQIAGLERAAGVAGLRFTAEATKYEAWERRQHEDDEEAAAEPLVDTEASTEEAPTDADA